MKRRSFIKIVLGTLVSLRFAKKGLAMTKKKLPTIFIGHGSPMNAINDNDFTTMLKKLGSQYEKPKAILSISAHWMTRKTMVTAMSKPKTIHDFYGFPESLYQVQYPAPGDKDLAKKVQKLLGEDLVGLDEDKWGLDHGTWTVLRHIYPDADIPVVQLSIDMSKPLSYHLELGKKLESLREEGILIFGSGNIVHNLRSLHPVEEAQPFPWAKNFDLFVKDQIDKKEFSPLVDENEILVKGKRSVPTPEHYIPLLYTLGASSQDDKTIYDFEGYHHGSLSMRCVRMG